MKGYCGVVLRINLTNRTIDKEPLNEELAKKFIGGRGLGTKMYYDEVDPKIDPLSPDNKLLFVAGPLTGTPTPTSGRYMVVTKGPLTGTIASSNSGGHWGAELKHAGYDVIILEGKADAPVYIAIEDDKVEIRDAAHLWGKIVDDTEALILKDMPEKTKIASIGPSGEKLSMLACIMNDTSRAAGRTGVGAVMGSKNLKAIAVRGTKKVELADEAGLAEIVKKNTKVLRENGVTGEGLPTYGSAVLVNIINESGILPTNNFQLSHFDEAEEISGERMTEKYLVRKHPCYRCPIACGRWINVNGKEGGGPEYETLWSFGSDCGVDDIEKIMEANFICNELGFDTISAGATIAAAMELYQLGLIKDEELDGVSLKFGDADILLPPVTIRDSRKPPYILWLYPQNMALRYVQVPPFREALYKILPVSLLCCLPPDTQIQYLPRKDPTGVLRELHYQWKTVSAWEAVLQPIRRSGDLLFHRKLFLRPFFCLLIIKNMPLHQVRRSVL